VRQTACRKDSRGWQYKRNQREGETVGERQQESGQARERETARDSQRERSRARESKGERGREKEQKSEGERERMKMEGKGPCQSPLGTARESERKRARERERERERERDERREERHLIRVFEDWSLEHRKTPLCATNVFVRELALSMTYIEQLLHVERLQIELL